ncbi:MerR family transcriptional regulator [Dactylosporangium sp. NPDC049742]|uniref:MerR family transcriptional regulator n=1 Tax=Dactylosporangium sp. NPDC049742 TaxID=3154737 RepID=UPI0034239B10
MRIGELAEQAGTSARALRYYEQQGLLSAKRTSNGYREYDEEDLRLVREIRALLEIGFNLEDTRPFVECIREGHSSGAECPGSVEVLTRRLAEIDDYIVRLRRIRATIVKELG